jgi:AcrR family transcriptional regulator
MSNRGEVSARQRLLAAGVDFLADAGPGVLRRLLTAEDLSKRAGVSRRTFYDNFETIDDFLASLREYLVLAEPGPSAERFVLGQRAQWLLNVSRRPPAGAGRVFAAVEPNESDDGSYLDRAVTELLDELATRGRPARGGFGPEGPVRGIGALLDGLAMDGRVNEEDALRLVLGLIASVTYRSVDGESSWDPISDLLDSIEVVESADPVATAQLRAMVLDKAIEEFRRRGFHETSVGRVAGKAGVSARAVRRMFGMKLDLAMASVDHVFGPVADAAGISVVLDPMKSLRALLEAVVREVQNWPEMGEVLAVVASPMVVAQGSRLVATASQMLSGVGAGNRLVPVGSLGSAAICLSVGVALANESADAGITAKAALDALGLG